MIDLIEDEEPGAEQAPSYGKSKKEEPFEPVRHDMPATIVKRGAVIKDSAEGMLSAALWTEGFNSGGNGVISVVELTRIELATS